jgi:uncharacterized protein with GYD domain
VIRLTGDPVEGALRIQGAMPIYVVLSNFTEQGRTDIKNTSERLDRLAPVADKLGVKVLANAITMGHYDVVTVMEAADDATIARVIGTVLSRGFVTTQTLRGFTSDEFRQVTAQLP